MTRWQQQARRHRVSTTTLIQMGFPAWYSTYYTVYDTTALEHAAASEKKAWTSLHVNEQWLPQLQGRQEGWPAWLFQKTKENRIWVLIWIRRPCTRYREIVHALSAEGETNKKDIPRAVYEKSCRSIFNLVNKVPEQYAASAVGCIIAKAVIQATFSPAAQAVARYQLHDRFLA